MEKIKLGVVFGGMSTENEVSIVSAYSILNNLDEMKYDIYPIYIDKDGKWWKTEIQNVKLELGANIENKKEIENEIKYLKYLDVVFPVSHGLYGEDGTIQGLFELSKIPYVGCKVLGSSIGMDKAYTKVIFEKAGLKRVGDRRDQTGGGARTYKAWLMSLGLIFTQESTGRIKLTLAGEAIMNGDSPVSVLTNQILKYQFPSAFSVGRGVQVASRFKIRPFRFLLKLLDDPRVMSLSEDEIAAYFLEDYTEELCGMRYACLKDFGLKI